MFIASTDGATALALRLAGVGQRSVTLAIQVTAPQAHLSLPEVSVYREDLRRFCEAAAAMRADMVDAAMLRGATPGELELRVWIVPATGRELIGVELALRRDRRGHAAQDRFATLFAVTPDALRAFETGLRAALAERIHDGLW